MPGEPGEPGLECFFGGPAAMAVFFRIRLAMAKTMLLETPADEKDRVSSLLVRPLQNILRQFIDSLTMEAKVNLSEEIMEVAFASKDAELLFATLFPASGPENKKEREAEARDDGRLSYLLDANVSMDSKLMVIIVKLIHLG